MIKKDKKIDQTILVKLSPDIHNEDVSRIVGLMEKYNIQGRILGEKLKLIEGEWVKNNFKISDQEVDSIVNN